MNSAASAAGSGHALARGEIADGGAQKFTDIADHLLNSIEVKVGQMIQLTIDPSKNYGADTTLIEWEIVETSGARRRMESYGRCRPRFPGSEPAC